MSRTPQRQRHSVEPQRSSRRVRNNQFKVELRRKLSDSGLDALEKLLDIKEEEHLELHGALEPMVDAKIEPLIERLDAHDLINQSYIDELRTKDEEIERLMTEKGRYQYKIELLDGQLQKYKDVLNQLASIFKLGNSRR